jgi:hypothetical protein
MTASPDRDAAVLRHLADGLVAIQIGRRLTPPLGLRAVTTVIADLASSLGVSGRPGMVAQGYRRGILTPVAPQTVRLQLDDGEVWLLSRLADDWSEAKMAAECGQNVKMIGTRLRRLCVRFGAVNRANLVKLAVDARVLRTPGGAA